MLLLLKSKSGMCSLDWASWLIFNLITHTCNNKPTALVFLGGAIFSLNTDNSRIQGKITVKLWGASFTKPVTVTVVDLKLFRINYLNDQLIIWVMQKAMQLWNHCILTFFYTKQLIKTIIDYITNWLYKLLIAATDSGNRYTLTEGCNVQKNYVNRGNTSHFRNLSVCACVLFFPLE